MHKIPVLLVTAEGFSKITEVNYPPPLVLRVATWLPVMNVLETDQLEFDYPTLEFFLERSREYEGVYVYRSVETLVPASKYVAAKAEIRALKAQLKELEDTRDVEDKG